MKCAVMIAGLALPLFGCVGGGADDTHKLVAVLPLSGDFKAQGENHKQGIQMAIDTLQRAGLDDVLGKPVSVLLVDAGQKETLKDNVAKAVTEAKAVKGQEFLGVISSTQSAFEASLPVAIENKVPHFEVAAGADESEFIHDHDTDHPLDETYAFNSRALCNDEAKMTADFIADRYAGASPKKKVLMFRRTATHDWVHTVALHDALSALPESPVEFIVPTNTIVDEAHGNDEGSLILSSASSWQDELEAAINEYQPDILYFHLQGDGPNQQALVDLSRLSDTRDPGKGFQGEIMTCGMARKKDLLDPATFPAISYLAGRFYFLMRAPVGSTNLTEFSADYKTMWGVDAHTFASGAFDGAVLTLLGQAVAKTNELDIREAIYNVATPTGDLVSYTTLNDAVGAVAKGQDIDYDGPSGTLDMAFETHIVPGDYYVEEVAPDGGKFKYNELDDPARQTLRDGEVMQPK